MAFEKFTYTGKSYKPKISLRTNGQIGFSQGAIKKFSLEKYKYAILYFDKEKYIVGIKLSNEEEDGVCRLHVRETNAAIGAKAFLDYYEIDYSKTNRYDAKWDEVEQMITAKIKESEDG